MTEAAEVEALSSVQAARATEATTSDAPVHVTSKPIILTDVNISPRASLMEKTRDLSPADADLGVLLDSPGKAFVRLVVDQIGATVQLQLHQGRAKVERPLSLLVAWESLSLLLSSYPCRHPSG